MAWTKTNFYISMIFITLIFFITIVNVGEDIVSEDRIDINEKSVDYILDLKGVNTDSQYQEIADTETGETHSKGILDSDDENQVNEEADFLSTLFIKKERAAEPTNFFKIMYNIPTSVLKGLGLPISDFANIINIISYILFIALIITVWRELIRT